MTELCDVCNQKLVFLEGSTVSLCHHVVRLNVSPPAASPEPDKERNIFICAAFRIVESGPYINLETRERRKYVYRCDLDEGHEGDHVDQVLLVNWPQEPEQAPVDGGNETKEVADLLNSMKVIDSSQRHMECRSDVLTELMYELAAYRKSVDTRPDPRVEEIRKLPRMDCACGLRIWHEGGHWVDSGGDRGDAQHRHTPSLCVAESLDGTLETIVLADSANAYINALESELDRLRKGER